MAMRDRRAPHVRLRQSGDTRFRSRPIRAAGPAPDTMRRYRPSRARRMPAPAQLILLAAIACLGIVMLFVGTGYATRAAGQLTTALSGALSHIAPSHGSATAAPSGVALDTPTIDEPDNGGVTNQSTVTVTGSVPAAVVGKTGYSVKIVAIQVDKTRLQVGQAAVGGTIQFSVPNVPLVKGPNTFVAELVGPQGPGEESPPVTYTLDTTAPTVTISSPTNNSQVTSASANVSGKTEPGATVTIRNDRATGGTTKVAGSDGKFTVSIGLAAGANNLVVTAVDQAGNQGSAKLTLKRSLGSLSAHLSVSPTRFDAKKGVTLVLTTHVTASNGSPISGAEVTFTVAVHGLGPITSPSLTTDAKGAARFQVVIPAGSASAGSGNASVLVATPHDGTVTGNATITTFSGS